MSGDWVPGKRDDIVNMGQVWMTLMAQKAAAWGIPQAEVVALVDLVAAAASALEAAKGADRSKTTTVRCRTAFEALTKKLRYLKEHYVHIPPLSEADWVSLLLRPRDGTPTPVPAPTGFAEADARYPGPGTLDLYCRPVAGQGALDPRGDYGFRIYWGVYPPGGAPVELATGRRRLLMTVPASGDELPHSLWTRRKKERMDFHEDRGSTAYFCIRYENAKGQAGPWGPLASAIIP